MSDTVMISIMSLLGSCVGTIGGILASSKLINFRLAELEEKVKKHNNIIERTYILEGKMTEAEHDIRDLKNRQ